MKLNGKNIITDKDITVTGAQNLGDNLSDILQKHQTELDSLKGNVKWLYKYGGTGSGGGGGTGGSNGKWDIFATLGGRTLSHNGVISLSKSSNSNYILSLSVKNGNGYFSVTISYDGGKTTTMTLSPENAWKTNVTLYLPKNEKINIVVEDGSDIKQIECDYITNPYEFNNIILVNNNNIEYQDSSGDILFEDARSNGLIAVVNYNISIEADASYKWKFSNQETEFFNIESNKGRLEFPIPNEILENNDNAGMYNISCIIEITPKNQEKEVITYSKIFNLIPETLYLKITPEVGKFYSNVENPENDIYKFKTSSTISFLVRAYYGNNLSRPGEVTCILSDVNEDGSEIELSNQTIIEPIMENIERSIGIYYITKGWKKLEVRCSMDGAYYSSSRYLYVEEVNTSYDWYKQSAEPTLTTYYRMGDYDNSRNLEPLLYGIYYQISNSDSNIKISKNLLNTPVNGGDILISLGIQYNEINNVDNPIITFNNNNNGTDAAYCKIYQNRIVIEDNYSTNIFFEKTSIDKYDVTNPTNYHLIQILFRHTYSVPNQTNQDYKQVCIYIDGVIETAIQSWFNYAKLIDNIVIHPNNYSINLLELSYFTNYRTRPLNDIDINYYYNTYKIKSRAVDKISEEENSILESLYNYDSLGNSSVAYTIENQMIKLTSSGTISTISKNVNVPTLVCRVERYLTSYDSNTSVFDWINLISLTEQDSVTGEGATDTGLQAFKCPVSLRWYNRYNNSDVKESRSENNGGSNISGGVDFSDTRLMSGAKMFNDANIEFYLRLQGSSTMRFKSKNLTLGVRRTSVDENAPQPVFSPNFLPTDSSTFLPDEAFTLKADIVDSSHSNNTSLGKFINDVYSAAGITAGNPEGSLRNHVKTCLEGFPILLFLEVSDAASGTAARETEYYYLGVYNFNLGRENQLNLGYIPLTALSDATSGVPDEYSFYTHLIPKEKYKPVDDLIIAEVQGNNPMWDFSQYDNSILFKGDNIKGDTNYMFGDIIYGSSQNTSYKNNIANFVRSVSGAGNYIFTSLGKYFSDIVDPNTGGTISHVAYRTENTVPNSDTQYSRNNDGKTYSPISRDSGANLLPPRTNLSEFTEALLHSCILETESDGNVTLEYLDYNSAVYYYTICMAFGLVDSVQKNLNIKTWNGRTFGLYFYDMDTALGTSNSGGDTSYFCFSDYWKTDITEYRDEEGNLILDSNGNPVYKNSGVKVYRDYYPEDKSLPSGYDIPSTYLFAISKYAACFESVLGSKEKPITLISPQSLWGEWRKKGGILESADVFIDKYFKNHLSKIPNILLNLNYRNKYLYTTTGNKDSGFGFNSTDIESLKGRQIQKVRDWLTSRFHLLDAYFNLGRESVLIYETPDKKNSYYEPFSSLDTLAQNTDIVMLHDIFSPQNTTLNRDGDLEFRIKAKNYTPLIHKHANSIDRLLIEDENKEYCVKLSYNGNQTSKFGGSDGWTYLDSLNSFILTLKNSGFHLNTKRLEHVEGTEGVLEGEMNLNIPSTKTLKLTSPGYKCDVKIDNGFYNLTKVIIDNSKIKLDISGSKVSEISANNVNSEKISLYTCSSLKKLSITDSKIGSFTATPIWEEVKDSLDLSGAAITNLILSGRNEGNRELIINNSEELESLTFSNFREIKISGCPNLTKVTCIDSTTPVISKLSIIGSANLKEVIILSDNLSELDLTGCTNLVNLELRKTNTNINLDNLRILKLGSTKIKRIKRSKLIDNNWVEEDNVNELNLTYYPNLTNFRINDNVEVEYVRVNNSKNNPFPLSYFSEKSSFSGCTKLKRVYGHIKISGSNSFSECKKFSIHGYYELIDGEGKTYNSFSSENGKEHIKYGGVRVNSDNGKVYHPLDSSVINNMTELVDGEKRKMKFQEGNNVTNITITGTSLEKCFYKTSCTLFDIYYLFQNLNEAGEGLNCSECFKENVPDKRTLDVDIHNFNWTKNYDNSPNRYMFKDWGYKLGNISSLFYKSAIRFRIFGTDSLNNPGLFYYLPNITNINAIFYGSTYFSNKNVFKTSSSVGYQNLTGINYFNPELMLDNINEVNYNDLFTVNKDDVINYNPTYLISNFENIGNYDGLLEQCPGLTTITNVLTSAYLINYDKFKISIPDTVENIIYSFVCSYATGTMNFSSMFKTTVTNNGLKTIDQSFRVNKDIGSINIGTTLELETVRFYLNNNIFKKFNGLTSIGYRTSNIDASTMLTSEYSSFGGFINKYLENGNFPYNIISHLTELVTFTGFFRNCNSINNSNQYNEIELPGTLFTKNTKLTNVSRCFQDFKGKIHLTSKGFENCKNLSNVSYLFCNTIDKLNSLTHDGSIPLGIQSSIPNKFFYHGNNNSTNLSFTGGNNFIDVDVSNWDIEVESKKATKTEEITENNINKTKITEFTNIVEFTGSSNTSARLSPVSIRNTSVFNTEGILESTISEQVGNINELYGTSVRNETITGIPNPIKTISDMSYCFQGQGWIKQYEHNLVADDIELCNQYQPYRYIKDTTTNVWTDNISTQQTGKYTYMWVFDGENHTLPENIKSLNYTYYLPDEDVDLNRIGEFYTPAGKTGEKYTCSMNFFCAPDLFRYSTGSVNINNIFNSCGYTAHLYLTEEFDKEINKCTLFGMEGRICPYLLKPIPDITSINGILANAKRLSYYYIENSDNTYLIPKTFLNYTSKITDLNNAFKGMIWPEKCDLQVFNNLTKSLKLDYTFQYPYFVSDSSNRFNVSGVFLNKSVLSAKATFSINNMPESLSSTPSYSTKQYVDFGINFTKSKMPKEPDANNPIVKCVYDGYSGETVKFKGYNLSKETTEEFRLHDTQNTTPFNYRVLGNYKGE